MVPLFAPERTQGANRAMTAFEVFVALNKKVKLPQNALSPVIARPSISAWTSWAPS